MRFCAQHQVDSSAGVLLAEPIAVLQALRSIPPGTPGLAFFRTHVSYQVSAEKLASQLETLHKVDAKLGVLIGALVTLASLYTATVKTGIAALILLVPAATSGIGYASRNWANPPNPIRPSEEAALGVVGGAGSMT
jgi:hypothetical protein